MGTLRHQALLFGFLSSLLCSALCDDTPEDTARVKAVYVYHFASFAEWPQRRAPTAEVRLCVAGGGETAGQLARLDGQELGDGHLLRVIPLRLEQVSTNACHMLFAGELPRLGGNPAWARLRSEPILSVSDQPGFAQNGGMIELFLRDNKVKMRINLGVARSAGILLSSKLLRLADIVETP